MKRRWYVLAITHDGDGKVYRVSVLNGLAGSDRKPSEHEMEIYRREYHRPPLHIVKLVSATTTERAKAAAT
jgi:hypothetical protein